MTASQGETVLPLCHVHPLILTGVIGTAFPQQPSSLFDHADRITTVAADFTTEICSHDCFYFDSRTSLVFI